MKLMSLMLSAASAALAIITTQATPADRQTAWDSNHAHLGDIEWTRAAGENRTNDTTWGFSATTTRMVDYSWDRSRGSEH